MTQSSKQCVESDELFYDENSFNIKEYEEYVTSDEYKKLQIDQLIDNQRLIKSLSLQNKMILTAFSDCERSKKVFDFVTKVWVNVLDNNTEEYSVEDIVNMALETEENIQFLNDNKNRNYFPSGKVFEENSNHPVQKKLTKSKHLSKRAVNKQKTPMQTISYVYSAKSNSDRDDRLAEIEKSLAEAHYKISLLAINQYDMNKQMVSDSEEVEEVKRRLSVVEENIKDSRKLKLYALYTSKKETSTKELSTEIGVNVRTVQRWLLELKSLGVIDVKEA